MGQTLEREHYLVNNNGAPSDAVVAVRHQQRLGAATAHQRQTSQTKTEQRQASRLRNDHGRTCAVGPSPSSTRRALRPSSGGIHKVLLETALRRIGSPEPRGEHDLVGELALKNAGGDQDFQVRTAGPLLEYISAQRQDVVAKTVEQIPTFRIQVCERGRLSKRIDRARLGAVDLQDFKRNRILPAPLRLVDVEEELHIVDAADIQNEQITDRKRPGKMSVNGIKRQDGRRCIGRETLFKILIALSVNP